MLPASLLTASFNSGFREVAHGAVLELTGVLAPCSPVIPQVAGSVTIQTSRRRYQPRCYWDQIRAGGLGRILVTAPPSACNLENSGNSKEVNSLQTWGD